MSVPARYQELRREAERAAREGRFREAALLRIQAREVALQHGDETEAFTAGAWVAYFWELAGEPLRALHLLTSLLADVPPSAPPHDLSVAKKRSYAIFEHYNPELRSLRRKLDDLEEMSRETSLPPRSDIYKLRANLLREEGRHAEALERIEQAWAEHEESGFLSFGSADGAVQLNLLFGRREAAGRWADLLAKTDIDQASSRVAWHLARVRLALWDQDPATADVRARDLEDTAAGLQLPGHERQVLDLRTRTLLLDPARGDPLAARHPARGRLATRVRGKPYLSTIYERRLLRGDYRLAAVRWLAGVPPVDDLYYTRPQDVPERIEVTDRTELQCRVAHARRTYRSARLQAEDLDRRFECDWRQKEVRGRIERLDEIVRAAS